MLKYGDSVLISDRVTHSGAGPHLYLLCWGKCAMGPLLLIVWRCKTDSVIENESVTRFRCSPASTTLSATGKLLSIVYSLLHREDVQNNCKLLRATEESQDNVPIAAATLDYVLFLRQIWSALALLLGAVCIIQSSHQRRRRRL